MLSVADFWRLIVESRLLTADEARQAADEVARAKPAAVDDLQQVASWLLKTGKLSRYQAKVLAAGKPGPFVYGDYVVYDRAENPRLAGLFRARHRPTKHPVCLSFLAGATLANPQSIARLMPQVAVARQASQDEPRLSACYHFVDLGAFKFLAIEDLRGDSLDERLKKSNAGLSTAAACRLVRLAALGLAGLHSLGQAHGHVRPANVWLDEASSIKLLQFPLLGDPLGAKAPPATLDAQLDYLAPELANPAAQPDPRSDVYSLGCLLFTLLAGEPPFVGGDRQRKLARHATEAPGQITKLNPQVPAALAQVLNYLLQKDPAKRYPDAAAVAEALQAYSGTEPQTSAEPTLAAYEAWLQRLEQGQTPLVAAQPALHPAVAVATAVAPVRAAGYPPLQPAMMAGSVMPVVQMSPQVITPMSGTSSVANRRSKKRGRTAATLGVIAGAVAMLAAVVWFLQSQEERGLSRTALRTTGAAQPAGVESTKPTADETAADPNSLDVHLSDKDSAANEPVQGIGQLIWQSPTDGAPLNLCWLPPGVQVVLALRPAELTAQSEWEKLVDKRTLGAVSQWLADDLPKLTGKTLDRLDAVLVGLLDGSPGAPRVALVARASEEFGLDDLRTAWGDARPEEIEGQIIHAQSGRAFYLPASGAGKLLVIAPAVELREMLETGGEAPALRREMEVLAESSDDLRQMTLLVAPSFILTDGKGLFVDEGVKLLEPLRIFLEMPDSDGKLELPKAALLSCHLGDHFFVELRIYDNFGRPAQSAAREFQKRIAQLPRQVSGYVRDLQLSNYSKPVLWDYKDQLDVLHQFTRLGVEGKQIVLRAYLPAMAAHNLALGAHLALLENPGSGAPAAVASTQQAKPQTVAERLKKKTTLSFPRNTLEQSLKLLGDDLGVEIIILGNDLRDEGITKNQSFSLDEKDQPADEILRKIMKLANPDGKLVYAVKPKDGSGEDVLYVTTRAAAKKRGDKLPPALDAK